MSAADAARTSPKCIGQKRLRPLLGYEVGGDPNEKILSIDYQRPCHRRRDRRAVRGAYGGVRAHQLRRGAVPYFAEALTLLPVLFPQAIPGLAVGCLVANLMGGYGIWDVVFGTLATLIAALLTYGLRKKRRMAGSRSRPLWSTPLSIGLLLHFVLKLPLLPTMGTVGAGAAGCGIRFGRFRW